MEQVFRLQDPFNKKEYADLPSTNGVYIFRKGEEYLYVGKSVNIKARVLSHVENTKGSEKEHAIVSQCDNLTTIPTDSEFNALVLESSLIQKYHPKYNVIWRDDKSYLYIKITKEKYPKIYPVRRENDGKSSYFGPYSSVADVEDLLRLIRKAIPYCTQRKIGKAACFYHKIGQCNPCPNEIETEADPALKDSLRRQYLANIRKVKSILEGKPNEVIKSLEADLKSAIENERYEEGILIRNKVQTLQYLTQFRSFNRRLDSDFNNSQESLDELKKLIGKTFPGLDSLGRIECYDISNLSQKDATASMVVLTNGLIDKSQYRKFRIKNLKLQSDFDMLEEVIRRRFRNKWARPDLIVIDGGKPQVRRVIQVMHKMEIGIPVIGIAKRPDRLVLGTIDYPTVRPKINNYGYRLVQLIRDESHRFAKKYHLFLRDKKLL